MKNHPGYKDYIKKAIRFAMEEMQVDLIHLDNTSQIGTGWDAESIKQFREFLQKRNRPGFRTAIPPVNKSSADPQFWRDWVEFRCNALEQYYRELAGYVRSVNQECAIDINPLRFIRGHLLLGVDHGRLLRHGHAYWDESYCADWKEGAPRTRIRSLKIGQSFNNSLFLYSESPLDVAEMMAFNNNCLGCITWFEGGELLSGHVGRLGKFPRDILPYVRFFHQHHDYYRTANPVADVALLHDFETIAFGSKEESKALFHIEQKLQNLRVPYAILFSQQQLQFNEYPAIIAAPQYQFNNYDGLVLRSNDPQLDDKLFKLVRIKIDAPNSVLLELQKQAPNRWLLHLVNYHIEQKIENVEITLKLQNEIHKVLAFDPIQAGSQNIDFEFDGSEIRFILPSMHVYSLVVIE